MPTIQVDLDRMTLGKFAPVDIPVWGDIGVTVDFLSERLSSADRPQQRADVAERRRPGGGLLSTTKVGCIRL